MGIELLTDKERIFLGKIIQKQRRSKRLSMPVVAKECHISQDTIVKIEYGKYAKEGNYFRYAKFLALNPLKLLVEYRRMNNLSYGQETVVVFPYSVGVKKYELMGVMTEMPGYKNIVIVTLMKSYDYERFSKDFPEKEKVAVARKIIKKASEKREKNEKLS